MESPVIYLKFIGICKSICRLLKGGGLWVGLQVMNGIAVSGGAPGIALFAHIGGFFSGDDPHPAVS